MKFDIIFEEKKNRFTLKTYGSLSMLGIKEMVQQLVSHPNWQKNRDLFIDHREASFDEISVEDILELSQMVLALDQTLGARRCSVISSDDGHFKNAMYKSTVDPGANLVTQLFLPSEYDEAIAWLDELL